MSATEELRRLLDERGVEWGNVRHDDGSESEYLTEWLLDGNQSHAVATERVVGGGLSVVTYRYHCTPEQAIAATLGGGKLTAEQVMAIAGKHQPDYCSDTHVCFDWQAIAEELNAALGGGECEFVIEDNMNETEGMGDVWFRCTNCHTTFDYYADDWLMKQNYCPHCGSKVRKAVKR